MSQDPNTIPAFDEWRQQRIKEPGKRPALLWGASRKNHRHQGEDFGGEKGLPVAPEADGEVIFAGPNGNMGNTVKVRHSDGYVSVYGHLNAITAATGAKIKKGEQIGVLGQTGNAKGPHVHYEVHNSDNLPIDPRTSPYQQPVIGRATRNVGLRPPKYDEPKTDQALSIPRFDEFVKSKAPVEKSTIDSTAIKPVSMMDAGKFGTETPPAPTAALPKQVRTPKPEAVIVQQAIRNPAKLEKDLRWHFGPSAIDDFQRLDVRGKQKMILFATQQAARDEIKKSQGQALSEDPVYQKSMRERVGIKDQPGQPATGVGELRQIDDAVVQQMQAPRIGMGDVRAFEGTEARQQSIVEQELKRTGPGLPSLRVRLTRRGLPPEVVGRALIALDPSLNDQVSVMQDPRENARILGEREAAQTIRERIEPKGTKLGAVAQQWPAFLGYVQDLSGKTVRLMNTAISPHDPISGQLPAPRIEFMNDVSDYLADRATINQQIAGYQPKDQTFVDKLTRAGVGTLYSVSRIAATVEATGLSLPTVMVGESLIQNSDKDVKTQTKEAAKAYAFGWALTKLPVLAQKGLGKIPGTVGRVVQAHPEASARSIGGAGFGTLGYAEAKSRGADTEEVIAETVTGVGVGAGLAGGGLKRIGEHAKRAPDVVIASSRAPEWMREAAGRATGKKPAVVQSEVAEGETPRFASVYVNPKTGDHVTREVSATEASKLLGRDRPAKIVPQSVFEQVLGPVGGEPTAAPVPTRYRLKAAPDEAKPAEHRATERTPETDLQWATGKAAQYGGSIEPALPAGSGYQIRMGDEVLFRKDIPSTVEAVRSLAAQRETMGVTPTTAAAPPQQQQEIGRITPKRIIKHSDPNIDGGEVIGTAPDGRLQIKNNSGGISLVQNPRTQGNENAAITSVKEEEQGGLTTSATQKAAVTETPPVAGTQTSQPEAGGQPATGVIAPSDRGETNLATQRGKVETVSRDREEIPQIRESRSPKNPTLSGTETSVAVPDSDTAYTAQYSVREAEDVIPSHNPQTFQPNPDYYHVNDRRYESETQYQMQVMERSKPGTFDPRRIANNSPTVDVGPPVIDSDGNVLGGNSRAMILHRVYGAADQSMAAAYRQELTNQAQMYGLDPAKIAEMKHPILVRELKDEALPQADTQRAITDLNRPSTTPLTADERATAAASQISPEAADYLTQQLENAGDDATVASVMDANGVAIINKLIADGIFQAGERNVLIKDGKPTAEAKSRIEGMLVSGVYRDPKQMGNTPPAVRRNIERIAVPLNKIAETDWDIAGTVRNAIDAVTESKANGIDLDKLAAQGSLTREPYTTNEIALAKILLLGPRKTAEKFRGYANDHAMEQSGGGLFGAPSIAESQKTHFGLVPEQRRIAPPTPEIPALPTRKPPAATIANVQPPGGWTDADRVPDKFRAVSEGVERYQWMRNAEGGQTFGTQTEILPLTEKLFQDYVARRLDEGYAANLAEYQAKTPDTTHIALTYGQGKGIPRPKVGTLEELRPDSPYVLKVNTFDSPEAEAHGKRADSEARPDPVVLAREMGRDAFAAGIKAAPALDPAMTELIKTRPKDVEVIALLEAWNKGWHTANLAAPVPGVKIPEPQWWIDKGNGTDIHMNQADVRRASGMLEKGKAPRKWDSLTADEQHALDRQWGRRPEAATAEEPGVVSVSDADAQEALSRMAKSHPQELNEVLLNWEDTYLQDGQLVRHLGREGINAGEDEFNTDAEIKPVEFIEWLFSDEPMDTAQFGDDPEWRVNIQTLREATGLSEVEPERQVWEMTLKEYAVHLADKYPNGQLPDGITITPELTKQWHRASIDVVTSGPKNMRQALPLDVLLDHPELMPTALNGARPNENGVYPKSQANKLSFPGTKNAKADADIYTLELPDGWIVAFDLQHREGSYAGQRDPLTIHTYYPTEADAILIAASEIVYREERVKADTALNVIPKQRIQAQKIIDWASGLIATYSKTPAPTEAAIIAKPAAPDKLYHLANTRNVEAIRGGGLKASAAGELGPGVYLTTDPTHLTDKRFADATQLEVKLAPRVKLLTVEIGPNYLLQVLRALHDRAEATRIYDGLSIEQRSDPTWTAQQLAQEADFQGIQLQGAATAKNIVIFDPDHVSVAPMATAPGPAAGTPALRRELLKIETQLVDAVGEERDRLEARAAEIKSQIPDYVEPVAPQRRQLEATIDAGKGKEQSVANEQLPQTASGATRPTDIDELGIPGPRALEEIPAEPIRGTVGERGSATGATVGAGEGESGIRRPDEQSGRGSVPGGRAGEEALSVSATGERAGDEPKPTAPIDHTIAAADADAVKPVRTPAEIIDGAKFRALENAEDSATSHAVTLTGDYFIDDVETFSSGSLKQKYQRNIDALVTLRQIQSEGRERATPEEQATLARWIGWGQFPALMNEINDAGKEWATERQALKSLLSEEEWNSAKASIKNAHYTAPQIVQTVWDAMRGIGFTRGRTLEPSMGPGIFFALMPRSMRKFSQLAGVELDKATGQIAKLLYPNADVQIKGFEEYNVSDDFFDLVISNFPFGDYQVADPRYPKRLKSQIHDYFFVKALDKVRPGGLVVGITSTGTLDKRGTAVREHLAERADLVAAIRLPGNTFLKEAGTAVVTDLVILRKRIPGEEDTEALTAIRNNKWTNTIEIPEPSGKEKMVVNEYYQQHPENIIGRLERSGSMWRADAQNVTRMGDFEDHLQRAVASLPKVYSVPKLKQFEPQVIPAPEELKQGSYTIKDGKLFQKTGEHLHEQSPGKDALARITGMIGVRDSLNKLLYVEIETPTEAAAVRKELGRVYDAFVKQHGFVNDLPNAKAFADDPDRYRLFALEKWDKKAKKATKTDIFTKATRSRYERPTNAKGVVDAVGIALNETGAIDLDRIASLLSLAPEDVGNQLVAQGVAFNDPKGGWTTRDTYLSGPVRQKLLEAEEAARLDPQYAPNVEALKAVQPQDVPHSKISARMGAPWIPADDIAQFMGDMMNAPATAFSVRHDKTTGRWYIGYRSSSSGVRLSGSVKDTEELGTPNRSFPEIIQAAIDDKPIRVTVKDGDTTYVDKKASAAANKKVREIRKKFANWIWQDDERRTRLHRQYNQRYNDTVPLKVDGSHQTFPGMNELITLRDNQKNVVWRGVTQGVVGMGHEVGTGKTFSMIAMGMERRRLKLSRKPAIACLNTNVAQVTEAAHLLYPGARILAAHEGMSADTRKKTVTQMATGDWDLIILTHDNLDDIPLSRETQQRFIQKEVDDLKEAVLAAKREAGNDKAGNRAVKDLEKKLENRKALLANILAKPKDDALTFEETGIDFLMVDEAHKFKSLPVYTARGSVKGIPTSRSDRATNMYMRSQWILERNNQQGLVMATGTFISNTLVELFNFQRYLQRQALEARGIDKFDPWAATFAESQTKLEYTATGDWLPVTRFSLFTNLADLSHLVSQVLDVAFAHEIQGLVRPKRKDHIITVPMNADQKAYLQSIRHRAAALAHAGRPQKGEDNWLVLTTDARKAAIDMRLIDRNYSDDPNSKLNKMISEVLAQQKEFPNLTQLIFSDMGINPTDRGISLYTDIIAKLVKGGIPREQIVDFSKFSPGSKTDQRAKAEGMERLSNGKAKIGIGGTEKLGTGVNVQELLYNLHHLDAPHRPSDIEQRDGRGWRDQNKNAEIRIGRYTTEGSFDTQQWQTLDTKNKFIRSFMRGDITTRTMEDEDTEELSYAQIMATTSGNPLLIKKMELEAEAAELESDFQVHQDQTFRLKDQIARHRRDNAYAEVRIKNLLADAARYQENRSEPWAVTVKGKTYTRDLEEEAAAQAHDEALREKNREAKEEVDNAKQAILHYKGEAKEKGMLTTKEQTDYAKAQVPGAFEIVAAFKKMTEADVEMMPQTKIAEATISFRDAIGKQIDAIKANWQLMRTQKEEGISQPFGEFKGFELVIVGDDLEHLGPALVGPSGEHHTFSWASARPGQVFADMENRIDDFDRQAESQERYVKERNEEIEQLLPLAEKQFADMPELERLRKAVDLVTQELTASGATLPLPEGYSNLSTRYKTDGKLMPEESPLDVHEEEGEWTGGELNGEPIFRDKRLVLLGVAPGPVESLARPNWDLVLDAHVPEVQLSPVAIEDITEEVWFDNGMTMPLGYFDIIMANHPQARYALTNSRRFPNTIVLTDKGKTVGYIDVGKPKSIDDDLQAAVRMSRERAASEVKAAEPPAEVATTEQGILGEAAAGGGGVATGGGGGPRKPPPDPLLSDENPEEAHAMAMMGARMPVSDVAVPGYEKARVSAAKVIKAYERILNALGHPTPVRVGHVAQRNALGVYKPRVEVIRLKTANNIPTAAHEIGHGIQKAIYGATKARALIVPANVKRELVAMGKALYGTRKPAGGYRTEGFAEFMRHYLTTDEAPTVAPNTLRWFETQLLPSNQILAEELRAARSATNAYRLQGAENRAAANMKGAPSLRDRIDRAMAATRKVPDFMLDEFSPLFRLVKMAQESQGPIAIEDDPAKVASVLRGSATTKVQYMVEDGMLDFASNKVGPPLQDAAAIVKGEKERFSIYMLAKRSQERWSKNINPGMTRDDADVLVAQLETPEYEIAGQQVYDWNNGILEYVKQAAPSFAPLIEKIQRTSQNYVPLARVFEPSEVKGSRTVELAGGSPLKRMKGSGRAIHDVFPQMIANAEKLIAAAHKRRVLDTIVRLSDREGLGHLIEEIPKNKVPFSVTTQEAIERLERMGAQIDLTEADLDEVMTFFTPAQFPKGQEPIVPVMRGGVMRWYYVNPDLYNTLMGMDLYRLPKLWDLLVGVPTRVFRAGTTAYRAAFALFTNPTRDVQVFVMQTRSHKNPALLAAYWTRSMAAAFSPSRLTGKRDEYLDTFYRLGAQLGQPLGLDIALTHKTAKRLFRGKIINTVTNPLEVVQEFLSLPESASRVAELRALADEVGWTPGTPMSEAQSFELALAAKQVTVDFSAAGRLAKIINQCSPFFNAGIQGGRSFARTMRDNPRRSVLRGLLLITIPTLLLWWRNKDKEWYTDMLDRMKYLYWHIEAGDQVVEIPKAFEWGNAFAVVPEVIFDTWYRKDPEGVKAAMGHIYETTVPDVLPVAARNAKEQWQNRIEFFDRPIVPRGELDLPPGEQRGPYTSRVAVWLGKKFPDTVSPRRVDALIRGFGGGVAPDILNVIGLGSQRGNRERELSDLPVFGRAFQQGGTAGFGSKAVESFYDQLSLVEARASSKDRPETNDQREYRLILEDANAALKVLRTVQAEIPSLAGRQQVTHIARQIAKTAIDKSLIPEQRVAKLDALMSETPEVTEKVKAEVERKRLAKAEERVERAPSRATFDLPGNKQIGAPPRPPSPPSPP